jgi:MFS family permease
VLSNYSSSSPGSDHDSDAVHVEPRGSAGTPAPPPILLERTTSGWCCPTPPTINASILLIALPEIFRGIEINPLAPGNTSYLLWLIMGYMVVTAVLVVSFGRLGDMYGRVKMYNAGFAVFTLFSILLSVTWMHGTAGVLWLVVMRILQGVGGAMLMGNSNAIITDVFPIEQRGLALGLNQVAGIAGSFIGLILGGLLGPIESLLGPGTLGDFPPDHAAYLTGRSFFLQLISGSFADGLAVAFGFAIAACLVAALVWVLRGGKYVHTVPPAAVELIGSEQR